MNISTNKNNFTTFTSTPAQTKVKLKRLISKSVRNKIHLEQKLNPAYPSTYLEGKSQLYTSSNIQAHALPPRTSNSSKTIIEQIKNEAAKLKHFRTELRKNFLENTKLGKFLSRKLKFSPNTTLLKIFVR